MNLRFRSYVVLFLLLDGVGLSYPGVAQNRMPGYPSAPGVTQNGMLSAQPQPQGVSSVGLDNQDVGHRGGAPKGWVVAGNALDRYLLSTDYGQGAPFGKGFVRLSWNKWYDSMSSAFATVMQSIRADAYRGKRMRLSAMLRTTNVRAAAIIWMRVEAQNGKVLAFDNMEAHPLVGTTPWQRANIVLDVPAESATISFGFLLAGSGEVMASDFQFDPVDATVATTAPPVSAPEQVLPAAPVNLEFRM